MSDVEDAVPELLVRWAGRMPLELIDTCLDLAVAGDDVGLAATVAHACLLSPVPITAHEADLVGVILERAGVDSDVVAGRFTDRVEPALTVEFAAVGFDQPDVVPGELDPAHNGSDPADKKAIGLVATLADARGLWRVWRASPFNARWPAPGRSYLVEVHSGNLVAIAQQFRDELRTAADGEPIEVLVYAAEDQLGDYALTARASAEMIWADTLAQPLDVVPIFDSVATPDGPTFLDRDLVSSEDREALLSYLNSGVLVLAATHGSFDVLAAAGGPPIVPMHLRTDGRYIWSDSTSYYLQHHNVGPHPALREQIVSHDFQRPSVTGVDIYRAVSQIRQRPEPELLDELWGSSSGRPDSAPAVDVSPTDPSGEQSSDADARPLSTPRDTPTRSRTPRKSAGEPRTASSRTAKPKVSVKR